MKEYRAWLAGSLEWVKRERDRWDQTYKSAAGKFVTREAWHELEVWRARVDIYSDCLQELDKAIAAEEQSTEVSAEEFDAWIRKLQRAALAQQQARMEKSN